MNDLLLNFEKHQHDFLVKTEGNHYNRTKHLRLHNYGQLFIVRPMHFHTMKVKPFPSIPFPVSLKNMQSPRIKR